MSLYGFGGWCAIDDPFLPGVLTGPFQTAVGGRPVCPDPPLAQGAGVWFV